MEMSGQMVHMWPDSLYSIFLFSILKDLLGTSMQHLNTIWRYFLSTDTKSYLLKFMCVEQILQRNATWKTKVHNAL